MTRIQGKLKATYELPLPHQTFQPLIRMYDNKHGIATSEEKKNVQKSILEDLEERDSLTSGSLYFNSEKHKIEPEKLYD